MNILILSKDILQPNKESIKIIKLNQIYLLFVRFFRLLKEFFYGS
jgi:hypothetical protein